MILKFLSTLLIFLSLGFNDLIAQEKYDDLIDEIIPSSELSNAQLKALRQELKVQKIFIEGIKAIEIQGGKFVDINKASKTVQDLLIKSIGAKTQSLPSTIREQVSKTVRESIDQKSLRNILIKTKDFTLNKLKNQRTLLTSMARRVGMDVGLIYLLTLQVDLTFPSIMIALGHFEYAPLLVTPVSSTATAAYTGVKSAVKFRQLIKNLGGWVNAKSIFSITKQVKKFFSLNIFPKYDLININIGNSHLIFTIERKTLFNKLLTKIGLNNNLNYENLRTYFKNEGILETFIKDLDARGMPNELKMLEVLETLELINDEEMMTKLRGKFGKFINELESIPDFKEARSWVAKISSTTNFDDFNRLILQIPDDIPPKIFDRLWRNHILPSASRNVGPFFDKNTFKAFRNMGLQWDNELRKLTTESTDTFMSENIKKKITEYIFDSLTPVNICGGIYQKKGDALSPLNF